MTSARGDAGRHVAARHHLAPLLDVGGGVGIQDRVAGGAARHVHAAIALGAAAGQPERIGVAQLVLGEERQPAPVVQTLEIVGPRRRRAGGTTPGWPPRAPASAACARAAGAPAPPDRAPRARAGTWSPSVWATAAAPRRPEYTRRRECDADERTAAHRFGRVHGTSPGAPPPQAGTRESTAAAREPRRSARAQRRRAPRDGSPGFDAGCHASWAIRVDAVRERRRLTGPAVRDNDAILRAPRAHPQFSVG